MAVTPPRSPPREARSSATLQVACGCGPPPPKASEATPAARSGSKEGDDARCPRAEALPVGGIFPPKPQGGEMRQPGARPCAAPGSTIPAFGALKGRDGAAQTGRPVPPPHPALSARRKGCAGSRGRALLAPGYLMLPRQGKEPAARPVPGTMPPIPREPLVHNTFGVAMPGPATRGSSFLATPGSGTQSLWDRVAWSLRDSAERPLRDRETSTLRTWNPLHPAENNASRRSTDLPGASGSGRLWGWGTSARRTAPH